MDTPHINQFATLEEYANSRGYSVKNRWCKYCGRETRGNKGERTCDGCGAPCRKPAVIEYDGTQAGRAYLMQVRMQVQSDISRYTGMYNPWCGQNPYQGQGALGNALNDWMR